MIGQHWKFGSFTIVLLLVVVFLYILHFLSFFLIFFSLISVSFILIEFVYKPLFFADEEELTEKKENSVIELTDSP